MTGSIRRFPFKGAFDNQTFWLRCWTALDAYGFLPPVVAGPLAPTLTLTPNGATVDIKCASQPGYTYTLESTTVLNPASWNPATGVTPSNSQAGAGSTLTFTVSATGANYFRVIAN